MMTDHISRGEPVQGRPLPSSSMVPREEPGVDLHAAAAKLQNFLRALPAKLEGDVFGDAALMILLDLFVAEHEKRRLPIKSVCIGSGAPQSTALRYIERLESAGLIRRHANPADRRSAHISMTAEAAEALGGALTDLFAERPR